MPVVNTDRFTGFAELYDSVRPQPPVKVVEIVSHILGKKAIGSVVDLGSGTGLSTRIWKGASNNVVGIEPTVDMVEQARLRNPEISFLNASSYETTLETDSSDVVVCSQAFHWMEPFKTLNEVNRILKSEGIFVVYDCQWPVSWYWPAEQAYSALLSKARKVAGGTPEFDQMARQYPKEKHLQNMKASGVFVHCGVMLFDSIEPCDAERFLGIALSQGHVQDILKRSPGKIEEEIRTLNEVASKSKSTEMRVSYLLNYGVKNSSNSYLSCLS